MTSIFCVKNDYAKNNQSFDINISVSNFEKSGLLTLFPRGLFIGRATCSCVVCSQEHVGPAIRRPCHWDFFYKICYQIVAENFGVKINLPPHEHRNSVTTFNHRTILLTLMISHHYFVTETWWQFGDNLPPNFITKNNLWQFVHIPY